MVQNLRYASRRLAKNPGFTLIAFLSLTLGIGANTAIFSLVNAVLFRDPPLAAPERLVEVYCQQPEFAFGPLSYPDFVDLREETKEAFEGLLAVGYTFLQIDVEDGVEMVSAELVSTNYFSLLGVQPVVGRGFLVEDGGDHGANPVVVLGYRYWQRAWNGDPDVSGREIRLGGRPYTIIGVAPETYTGNIRGLVPDLYAPIILDNELNPTSLNRLESRGSRWIFVKGRLRPEVTVPEVQVTVAGLVADLQERAPEQWGDDDDLVLVPTLDVVMNPVFDRFILPAASLLMAVVGLVLLIACANLASFLLAQAADRKKEIALRLALGASRRSLMGQLMTETVLLSFVSATAGVLLAAVLIRFVTTADLPLPLPIKLDLAIDIEVLSFTLALSVAAGFLFGLAPALQGTRPDLAPTLKDDDSGMGSGSRRLTLRKVLVTGQVAVSLLLLLGAGLVLRSLTAVKSVDPGFGRQPTAILSVLLPTTDYSQEEGRLWTRALVERVEELPGITRVGVIDNLHLNPLNNKTMGVNVDGVEPPPGRDFHSIDYAAVDPGFFDAAGIDLVHGRNFTTTDHEQSPPVAIVSQALASRFWPDQDPVGRILRRDEQDDLEVVGVAQDVKVRTLGEVPRPFIYRPFSQAYSAYVSLIATTEADARETALAMFKTARSLDSKIRIFETKTMERHLAVMLLPAEASAFVLSIFAGLALALASIGIYGIVSYSVAQRTREVGIRMSLGADTWSVVRLLMTGGIRLVAIGGVVGLGLAAVVTRVLSRFLFGVGSLDPWTFILVPLLLAAIAFLATYLPAHRASRIHPVLALKS